MSQPIAINCYTLAKDLFYEGMREISRESYGKTARRAVLFLTIAWLALAVVTLLLRQNPVYIAFEFLILFIIALWLTVFFPRYKAKRAWNQMESKYGIEMERTITVFEDRLEISAAGTLTIVQLKDVSRQVETERLFVLITEERVGVIFVKDAFETGDCSTIKGQIDLVRKAWELYKK